MYEVSTEQSITLEKDWRASSIGNTRRAMARNQH